MKRALVLVVCALVACGKEKTGGADQPPPAGLTLLVGTGYAGFEPLANGAEVQIIHGPQGGSHIWGAVRAERIAKGSAKIQYKVKLAGASPVEVSASDYVFQVDSDPWEWAGLIGFVPNPDEVADKSVILSISIEDAEGHKATAETTVVAHQSSVGTGSGPSPSPRGDFAAAIDPVGHQLVLFGGDPGVPVQCSPVPRFDGETWTFSLDNNTWTKLEVEGPVARSRHASAFDTKRRRLLIFGGRFRTESTGPYTVFNDTWAFDVATSTWSKLETTGDVPVGLSNAIAVYDPDGDRFIVYGGNSSTDSLTVSPRTDTWVLSLGTNTWSTVTKSAPWPGREYHSGVWDSAKHRLIVFGGAGDNPFTGPFFNDVWSLDVDTETWTGLKPSGDAPTTRIRPMAAMDAEHNRMLLFGGHDSSELGERNDLWALEFEPLQWVQLRPGDTLKSHANAACDYPADFTTPDLASPERRASAFFGVDPATKNLVLYGGRTDCGNIGDVWTLSAESSTWQRTVSSYVGESCVRSGRQSCASLCF